jgi:hypothetical protein
MISTCRLAALPVCILVSLICLTFLYIPTAGSTAVGPKVSTEYFLQHESIPANQRDRSIPLQHRLSRRQGQEQQQQQEEAPSDDTLGVSLFLISQAGPILIKNIRQIIDTTVKLNFKFGLGELLKLNLPCLKENVRLTKHRYASCMPRWPHWPHRQKSANLMLR